MVAQEVKTGRVIRLWRNELLALAPKPRSTSAPMLSSSPTSRVPSSVASWNLAGRSLRTSSICTRSTATRPTARKPRCGDGLLGALALRGLGHIDAGEKDEMRRLILDRQQWSDDEKRKILDYCATDVTGTVALFSKMAPSIDWPRALLRGRYMKAVGRMERNGVPIDTSLHREMVTNWGELKVRLIASVDADFGVYEGTSFRANKFAELLSARRIAWPKYPAER